jgi:hypothetical protein
VPVKTDCGGMSGSRGTVESSRAQGRTRGSVRVDCKGKVAHRTTLDVKLAAARASQYTGYPWMFSKRAKAMRDQRSIEASLLDQHLGSRVAGLKSCCKMVVEEVYLARLLKERTDDV